MLADIEFIYVNYFSADVLVESILSLKILLSDCNLVALVYIVDNSFVLADSACARNLSLFAVTVSTVDFRVQYSPSDTNLGFGSACNKVARYSTSRLILFVNCDTLFHLTSGDNFLNMLALFDDPSISIVGPKVLGINGHIQSSCFSFDPISILLKPFRHLRKMGTLFTRNIPNYNSLKRRIDRISYEGMINDLPCYVDWVSGCFLLVRSSFFHTVGGFDKQYFMYFEDVDLCRKARQLGQSVLFDPRVSVTHIGSYASSHQKGIFRSILFNSAARHHILSWLKYCFKWRIDIFTKFSLLLGSFCALKKRPKCMGGYSLDFSVYKIYDRI